MFTILLQYELNILNTRIKASVSFLRTEVWQCGFHLLDECPNCRQIENAYAPNGCWLDLCIFLEHVDQVQHFKRKYEVWI
jgi:hypothetical protein